MPNCFLKKAILSLIVLDIFFVPLALSEQDYSQNPTGGYSPTVTIPEAESQSSVPVQQENQSSLNSFDESPLSPATPDENTKAEPALEDWAKIFEKLSPEEKAYVDEWIKSYRENGTSSFQIEVSSLHQTESIKLSERDRRFQPPASLVSPVHPVQDPVKNPVRENPLEPALPHSISVERSAFLKEAALALYEKGFETVADYLKHQYESAKQNMKEESFREQIQSYQTDRESNLISAKKETARTVFNENRPDLSGQRIDPVQEPIPELFILTPPKNTHPFLKIMLYKDFQKTAAYQRIQKKSKTQSLGKKRRFYTDASDFKAIAPNPQKGTAALNVTLSPATKMPARK